MCSLLSFIFSLNHRYSDIGYEPVKRQRMLEIDQLQVRLRVARTPLESLKTAKTRIVAKFWKIFHDVTLD